MLCEVPLTKEQQTFATAHHSLVYKFLNENRLPEDEFYDVVIFGYLKAVRDYFSDLTAQQFTFSTIANRRMKFCLFDYFRTQERRKRNMEVLSIHVGLYPDGAPLEDGLAIPTGRTMQSGFCTYPEYRFRANRLQELDPEGYAGYLKNFERRCSA